MNMDPLELEKEQIRERIIMEEMMRRRNLEAEVRRELEIEREMAMLRGTAAEALSFEERLIVQINQRRLLMYQNQPCHAMDGRFAYEGFRYSGGRGAFDAMPPPPLLAFPRSYGSMVPEVKSLPDSRNDKLIELVSSLSVIYDFTEMFLRFSCLEQFSSSGKVCTNVDWLV